MEFSQIKEILEPQLGYLAKSSGEQLFSHHYTVWSVLSKIIQFIPSLDDRERYLLQLSALLHDVGKMREENQRKLREGSGITRIVHKITHKEELDKYFNKVETLKRLEPLDKKFIYDVILTHHSVSKDDLSNISTSCAGIHTELLRYADHLASMDYIDINTVNRIRKDLDSFLDLTYFQVSRFPSPTTYLFLGEGIRAYREKGWQPLLIFDNAALFIGKKGLAIPDKSDIVNRAEDIFFERSLSFQSEYKVFTKCVLAGLSCLLPARFMKTKKDNIIDNLGNADKKGGQFFRLLQDIYALEKKKCDSIREKLPVCDLIQATSGPSGHPRAKRLWKKLFKEKSPASINESALSSLLAKVTLIDIVPPEYLTEITIDKKKLLSRLKSEELFELLHYIALKMEEKVGDHTDITRYLEAIVSLEEKRNFKELTKSIFEHYKKYKKTNTARKGACERCGCPIADEARPVLGYEKGEGYGFSQIKANPSSSQATCLFCAYDNMAFKKDKRGGGRRVLVRIETKVPELLKHYEKLDRFVTVLKDGVTSPRDIARLEEREEFRNLPFSKKLEIPLPSREPMEECIEVLRGEHGILFGIDHKGKKEGVKSIRVRYEPLYHALNLLGFTVSIGIGDQPGLFGEEVITTEGAYFNSLATILLAQAVQKRENKFLFARELIAKSPSVALRCASEEKKGKPVLGMEKLRKFYLFLYRGDAKIFEINKEVYSMKNLLKDAVFFADKEKGIPHFCVEPEKRGEFWRNLTRHSATKPVAQALDEIMMGREFDFAMERFIRNLAVKIPKEKQAELNDFVLKTKDILSKYYELRQENISRFIRARNALTSAVYVFTRYSKLKEVTNE